MKAAQAVLLASCTLWAASPLTADTYTVGPGGTHATVQGAIDSALAAGGPNEIRIARGAFTENAVVIQNEGELTISGDWNAVFSERGDDPSRTILDGGGSGRALEVTTTQDAVLNFEMLTFRNGVSQTGGVSILAHDGSEVRVQKVVVRDNRAFFDGRTVSGGGLYVSTLDSAHVEVLDCDIANNAAIASTNATGGGLSVAAAGTSRATFLGNRIIGNSAERFSPSLPRADFGGLYIVSFESGVIEFFDNEVRDNTVDGGPFSTHVAGGLLGVPSVGSSGAGRIEARRNRWLRNRSSSGLETIQVQVFAGKVDSRVDLTDSVVAGSEGTGIDVFPSPGTIRVTNNTITGFEGSGARFNNSSGAFSLYNNLFATNGMDLEGPLGSVDEGNNLLGLDPLFVNPAAGNYALRLGSPAIDAGTPTPPGELGPFDVTGRSRIEGATVDIGAYEWRISPCVASATTLCLVDDRFQVDVDWRPGGGVLAPANAEELTDDAGYFFFNNPNNIEVVIKMSNACSFNNRFWFFAAGLTNVEVQLTVTDTESGEVRTYGNALGTPFAPIQDTAAFATCP